MIDAGQDDNEDFLRNPAYADEHALIVRRVGQDAAQLLLTGSETNLSDAAFAGLVAQTAAAVLDGGMSQALVGGEHLEILARAGEDDLGVREGLFGGSEQYTGHGDVRAQRHA